MAETELVLSAISGAKLMDLEFMPQEFVVRGLLPKGLSILGGAPKIGKSWLMLELALRVAKEEPMWGMETKQGTVLYKSFKKVAEEIGSPETRFHDLRHSYAVASIQSGDDIKTVQENLGHATAAFTLDVYGHVTQQMKQESANRMEQFFKAVNA